MIMKTDIFWLILSGELLLCQGARYRSHINVKSEQLKDSEFRATKILRQFGVDKCNFSAGSDSLSNCSFLASIQGRHWRWLQFLSLHSEVHRREIKTSRKWMREWFITWFP